MAENGHCIKGVVKLLDKSYDTFPGKIIKRLVQVHLLQGVVQGPAKDITGVPHAIDSITHKGNPSK